MFSQYSLKLSIFFSLLAVLRERVINSLNFNLKSCYIFLTIGRSGNVKRNNCWYIHLHRNTTDFLKEIKELKILAGNLSPMSSGSGNNVDDDDDNNARDDATRRYDRDDLCRCSLATGGVSRASAIVNRASPASHHIDFPLSMRFSSSGHVVFT